MHALYVLTGRQDPRPRDLVARAEEARVTVHPVDHARLDALAGHGRHQGVVAIVDDALPHVTLDDVLESLAEPPLLLVLDGVTDPHNLGACLRCADAFGAQAVIVPKDRAVGVNATVAKAASRRGRYGTGDRGHQSRAHDARSEGARRLAARRRRRRRSLAHCRPVGRHRLGARAPKARGCAGSPASPATASSAFR